MTLCCVKSSSTSLTEVPLPQAILTIRDGSEINIFPSESSSLVVMLSKI